MDTYNVYEFTQYKTGVNLTVVAKTKTDAVNACNFDFDVLRVIKRNVLIIV